MKRVNFFSLVFVSIVIGNAWSFSFAQSSQAEVPSKGSQVGQKAVVTKKPEPKYTKEAKQLRITGTVVLRCVFRASGKITDIAVIQGLPNGLTERAIEAARKIKFKPAIKDGHPVSMWMQLEYNFNLH
jgi:TonB family protein